MDIKRLNDVRGCSSTGILFLGGANRVSMARKFRDAAAMRGHDCRIYSYEMEMEVPVAIEGEIILGRRWRDPAVCDDILRICRERGISIVIPFVDGAVAVAADVASRSRGTDCPVFAPTGDSVLAELMFDKVRAAAFFEGNGLPVPSTVDITTPTFPVIAKPRHGSASMGIEVLEDYERLCAFLNRTDADDYLFQRYIVHRTEYTVDCYVSMLDGRVIAAVPRIRDRVAGGEVTRTTVCHNDRIDALVRRTLAATGLRGAITVQIIHDRDNDQYFIMEINPRLGGGAVATVCAGVSLPGLILDEAAGRTVGEQSWRDMLVCRYLDEVSFPY